MSNQHDQDRDRIAEAMYAAANGWDGDAPPNCLDVGLRSDSGWKTPCGYTIRLGRTLDAAIAAFETLCEPKGWELWRAPRGEYEDAVTWYAVSGRRIEAVHSAPTGNHAADVCRLVCEVLDREAKKHES